MWPNLSISIINRLLLLFYTSFHVKKYHSCPLYLCCGFTPHTYYRCNVYLVAIFYIIVCYSGNCLNRFALVPWFCFNVVHGPWCIEYFIKASAIILLFYELYISFHIFIYILCWMLLFIFGMGIHTSQIVHHMYSTLVFIRKRTKRKFMGREIYTIFAHKCS